MLPSVRDMIFATWEIFPDASFTPTILSTFFTSSNCTRTAIDMSKEAADYGADGLLLVTPYYNKATQAGLIAHYGAVAKEAKMPDCTSWTRAGPP